MPDIFITLVIVGVCAFFLGYRFYKNFRGAKGSCGCACSGCCPPSPASRNSHNRLQAVINPLQDEVESK